MKTVKEIHQMCGLKITTITNRARLLGFAFGDIKHYYFNHSQVDEIMNFGRKEEVFEILESKMNFEYYESKMNEKL